jgi:hypothetical protein
MRNGKNEGEPEEVLAGLTQNNVVTLQIVDLHRWTWTMTTK